MVDDANLRHVFGRILEKADPETFFTRPQHPRAQRFLSDLRAH